MTRTSSAFGDLCPPVSLWQDLREQFSLRRRLLDVVQIEVTSVCPGRCAYCPHVIMAEHWKSRHMDTTAYARLWPLLRESVRAHLQGWGEPFSHPRFLDMVALARKAGCFVSTTTCGLHMTEDFAKSLVESGLDIIAFSLAGTTAASNDVLRRGVDFSRVMDSIRLLNEVRTARSGVHLEIHIAYLALASRISEVRRLPELMRELGVHAAVVSTLDPNLAPGWAHEAYAPDEQDKIAVARAELDAAAAEAARLGLDFDYSLPEPTPRRGCLENADRTVFVDAQGCMSTCVYLNPPTTLHEPNRRIFGSCLEQDPVSIWKSDAFSAFRAGLLSGEPDAACLRCPKRHARSNRE
ncbi:radical SAM protein [Desulfomicrobium baculatum]|uniref:Radical SAM domain protein n=1 Tax=Desulfomicrobium baculatum (strain DSM 4028 / VKM B-1378 / X) TaxID=525897 RepID=C7LWU5_DESBD|nr:radical SAM protein [Desulfomicrobium baculatum]ACU91155.1 Radical SAM domain protein [Desulfomicrobium baculatum DSM 4028]